MRDERAGVPNRARVMFSSVVVFVVASWSPMLVSRGVKASVVDVRGISCVCV